MKIFHQIKVLISINRSIFMMSNLKTSPKNLSKKKQTNKQKMGAFNQVCF